jgi:hypothetical protein
VTIRGSNLGSSILEEAVVDGFKASLQGPLFRPGEAGYDDNRKIWNGMIDKRPVLIASCRRIAEVINSVNFARKHELLVAVRGRGHNVAGNAVCDGGLMIDPVGDENRAGRSDARKCTRPIKGASVFTGSRGRARVAVPG